MSDGGDNKGIWGIIVRISVVVGILGALAGFVFPFLPKGQFNSNDNQTGSNPIPILTTTQSESNPRQFSTITPTGSVSTPGGPGPSNTGSTGSASTQEGLRVAPTGFTVIRSIGTSGCTYYPNSYWICKVHLYNNTASQLSWNAAVPDGSSISVEPSPSGIIPANNSWSPDINIPDLACPAQADITFSVGGGSSVVVHWNCTG